MPVEIYEDTLELECESLQPQSIRAEDGLPACWPMPALARSGQRRVMTLRTVVLTNDWVQVTVCPDLGGRIVAVRDRRTQTDIIPLPRELELIEGGPRGVWSPQGIQWVAGEPIRRCGLGQVEDMIHEPDEDDAPGAILLFELIPGTRLSWHGAVTLHPDRAEITLEMSLYNRSVLPQPMESGVRFGPGSTVEGSAIATGPGFGLLWQPETPFASVAPGEPGVAAESRPESLRVLMPRGTETWRVRLIPYSQMDSLRAASRDAAAGMAGGNLALLSARKMENALLEVEAGGDSARATLTLNPEHRMGIELPEGASRVILSHEEAVLLDFDPSAEPEPLKQTEAARSAILDALLNPPAGTVEAEALVQLESYEEGGEFSLNAAAVPPMLAPAAMIAQADRSRSADLAREAATLNPQDALGWWLAASLRSVAKEEEGDELMQAHALAPLEPMLRAEGFLRQDETLLTEPSTLLRPLARAPDLLLACVETLIRGGRAKDAARLLDEAIRHLDCVMYRIAFAGLHESATGMRAEAAQHLMAASKLPPGPPYPWRPHEQRSVMLLAERHPQYRFLNDLAGLVRADEASRKKK